MKEKDIQTLLSKKHTIHGVFELKICKKKRFPFNAVKEHQKEALWFCANEGFFHKISDFPMFKESKTRFNRKKPFDFFYLEKTPAYIIICFYVPRRRKTCYYVSIGDWELEEDISTMKSITEDEIEQISTHILEL